jgi:hypothetical protein
LASRLGLMAWCLLSQALRVSGVIPVSSATAFIEYML